jgi:competence protein ComEC
MKWRILPRQPFVGLAISAGAGIILADFFPSFFVASIVTVITALIALRWSNSLAIYLLAALAFFALHSFRIVHAPGRKLADHLGIRSRTISVTGAVVSEPKISRNGFATFLLKLDSVEIEGRTEYWNATVRARWKGTARFGNQVSLFGTAQPISATRNPGVFDMKAYLARHDVWTEIFVRYPEHGSVTKTGGGNPILRFAHRSREWMQTALSHGLDDSPQVQALISGMALGIRHETPNDIEEPFQQTGTLHLFAVAGLHVGIVARLLWIFATVLRLSRRWATALIIPSLLFYAAVTGLHVSSIRAAIMASVLLAGFFADRRVFVLNSLAAAAVILFALDTNELFSTGFQLSFAVVTAILLFADRIFHFLLRRSKPDQFLPRSLIRPARRTLDVGYTWIARGISISLAAWIGSFPLLWWYFHLITSISFLANLVVVPIAFFILAIAMISMVTVPFSSGLSLIFNNANWSLAQLILAAVHLFAQCPGGHFYVERPHWPSGARTEITVLDLGAGGAIHVRAGDADWLFDAGSARDYVRVTREYLHSKGVDQLDGLVLSHGDSLHIGGASELTREFKPKQLIDNGAPDRSRIHRAFSAQTWTRRLAAAGDHLNLERDIATEVIFPRQGYSAKTADDQALVIRLVINPNARVLLMSDSGYSTEQELLASGTDLRSEILIKGQHHSGQSGSSQFLDAVQPKVIIATSCDFPEHERIRDDWAQMVRDENIMLFRQDETGAVNLKFFQHGWTATGFINHETFRSDSR